MKIYQLDIGLNYLYKACLEQFASKIPAGHEHIVLTSNPFPELDVFTDIRTLSNSLRMKLLSQPGDVMWADADTTISEWPEDLDKSKPWLSSPNGRFPNASVIISHGHKEFFKKIYEEDVAQGDQINMTYVKVLAKYSNEYNLLPKNYFNEINLSATRGSKAIAIGTENFGVIRDKNNEWKFSFLKGVTDVNK